MRSDLYARLLPYVSVFARLALGAVFLSVVADRVGLWGPPGAANVAWGAFGPFLDNVRLLNPYLPDALVPAVGWGVTLAELAFGVLLIVGFQTRWVALGSGLLLLTFALSTGLAFGIKVPLNYSIFSAAAAALLLAGQDEYPFSVDRWRERLSATEPPRRVLAAFLLLPTVALLPGCAPTVPPGGGGTCPVEGAWEVVSLRLTDSDGTVQDVEIGDPPGLKVLSATHWAFVERGAETPVSGGGGRYEVDGDTYTEYVEYHAAESFVGQSISFECQVEGNHWYQSGMLPGGTYLEEVFRRAR